MTLEISKIEDLSGLQFLAFDKPPKPVQGPGDSIVPIRPEELEPSWKEISLPSGTRGVGVIEDVHRSYKVVRLPNGDLLQVCPYNAEQINPRDCLTDSTDKYVVWPLTKLIQETLAFQGALENGEVEDFGNRFFRLVLPTTDEISPHLKLFSMSTGRRINYAITIEGTKGLTVETGLSDPDFRYYFTSPWRPGFIMCAHPSPDHIQKEPLVGRLKSGQEIIIPPRIPAQEPQNDQFLEIDGIRFPIVTHRRVTILRADHYLSIATALNEAGK